MINIKRVIKNKKKKNKAAMISYLREKEDNSQKLKKLLSINQAQDLMDLLIRKNPMIFRLLISKDRMIQ